MQVLVTGAAGFIGSRVAHHLLGEGHQVVGVDALNDAYDVHPRQHRPEGLRRRTGFSFAHGDLCDEVCVEGLPWKDLEQVQHLAARAGVRQSLRDPHAYVRDNVTATIELLEAARRRDLGRLLASTSSLYGAHNRVPFREDADTDRPLSPYAASKKGAEAMMASARSMTRGAYNRRSRSNAAMSASLHPLTW